MLLLAANEVRPHDAKALVKRPTKAAPLPLRETQKNAFAACHCLPGDTGSAEKGFFSTDEKIVCQTSHGVRSNRFLYCSSSV